VSQTILSSSSWMRHFASLKKYSWSSFSRIWAHACTWDSCRWSSSTVASSPRGRDDDRESPWPLSCYTGTPRTHHRTSRSPRSSLFDNDSAPRALVAAPRPNSAWVLSIEDIRSDMWQSWETSKRPMAAAGCWRVLTCWSWNSVVSPVRTNSRYSRALPVAENPRSLETFPQRLSPLLNSRATWLPYRLRRACEHRETSKRHILPCRDHCERWSYLLVMIQALFQSKHEKHERQRDDECHRLGPLEYDFRGRHREMLDLGSLGQGDVRWPVLLLDQLFDVTHAVGYHVIEHESVQTGEPLLR